jgi:hypothetical protein
MLGFALAFIMLFISTIYLYHGIKYHRMQKKIESGVEPFLGRRMSASTRAIMEVQISQEEAKNKTAYRVAYGIYCILIALIFTMTICRFSTLVAHKSALNDITTFPSGCSSWAENGCAYITMQDNCVRGDDVISRNSTTTFTTLIP